MYNVCIPWVIPPSIERRVIVIEPEDINLDHFEKIGEDIREILEYILGCFYVN